MSDPADLTQEDIFAALKKCFDPEMPVNIVDLGLVYEVDLQEGGKVYVKMTLTTQACGMGTSIMRDAEAKILAVKGVSEAHVELVWDPPWTHHLISEEGRKKLGMA
jgi:metal-sulfur cluster biosynthetic enzyme